MEPSDANGLRRIQRSGATGRRNGGEHPTDCGNGRDLNRGGQWQGDGKQRQPVGAPHKVGEGPDQPHRQCNAQCRAHRADHSTLHQKYTQHLPACGTHGPQDADVRRLRDLTQIKLNLEMAATEEMLEIALRHKPHAACIVPERREERTTEGGLDAAGQHNRLAPIVSRLADAGIRVSLFIAPEPRQIEAAMRLGAPVVELHTGEYAHAEGEARAVELKRISDMAALAARNGIEPHAGHGLTYDNVQPIAAIPQLAELNIGHYLIGEAIFCGLDAAVRKMRELMDAAR